MKIKPSRKIHANIQNCFLVNDQRDAHILFYVFISICKSTCFEHVVFIIRRDKLYQYSLR